MIYSEDINKVCALCTHASKVDGTDEVMYCELKKQNMPASTSDCGKFSYDIFKKVVHRKKRLKTDFSAEDFSLE
ncbi:MAG: hypothetical protein ACI4EA_01065 [Candidatus Ornithomonoglobus sp.]